ncbi:hypothetical protein [Micromonospora aurantiaca (nom. illeg.)]|uniref:hypothetical protein n=1 Tax=Micromonospora aurantiaca (nom. illeg.) TaxID=47850 RepID=UPI003EB7DE07
MRQLAGYRIRLEFLDLESSATELAKNGAPAMTRTLTQEILKTTKPRIVISAKTVTSHIQMVLVLKIATANQSVSSLRPNPTSAPTPVQIGPA